MPWYLAFKQLFPSGKKIPFFTLTSVLGVALGVMVLLVVQSVMNGFSQKIQETVQNITGDIRLTTDGIFYDWEETAAELGRWPFIRGVSPFAEGAVMLQYADRPVFPLVRGIDLATQSKVAPLDPFVTEGSLEKLSSESVILTRGVANQLGASLGAVVDIYTPLMLHRMKEEEVLLPRELEVAAIVETGWNKVDGNLIFISLDLMQDLYGMNNGVHGLSIALAPNTNLYSATEAINRNLEPPMKAMNYIELNEDYFFVLKLEKTMMFFIILFVILVAAFSITSSLLINVVRKTREIGLLGAIGATRGQVAMTFLLQGLCIGVIGTGLGIAGAFLGIHFRNEIVYFLARLMHREAVIQKFYQFADIPAHYLWTDFALVAAAAIVIATLAGLIPAIRAARLNPAQALRNE